jgi:hypothetical protein
VLQQVVLEGFAAHDFTGTALLEPLGGSLTSFELWHIAWLNKIAEFFQLAQSIILVPKGDRRQASRQIQNRSKIKVDRKFAKL